MNLQHLKHFLAVAEELHFGRAAERIGMAQPPLSQSIRRLEDSLGCRLFIRTRRQVELTPAGETLLQHAREILNQLEYAQKAVLRAHEAGLTRVTIGFTPNALSDAVPKAMLELRRLAPGVEVHLQEGNTSEQINGLLTGKLDLGFVHAPSPEISGLELRLVETSAPVAAIPTGWPLAERAELQMADFADLPLLMYPSHHKPEAHAALLAAFRAARVTPKITQEASYDATRLRLVAAGLGISFVNRSSAPVGYPGVEIRPVIDLPACVASDLSLAWRRGLPASIRKLFLATYESAKHA
jgi:DNA-binding transcriptional LysR family regulator